MRTIDKLIIGVPAVAGGVVTLTTKVGASMILLGGLLGYWLGLSAEPVELSRATALALLAGMAALGSFIWKQFSNFKNRKLGRRLAKRVFSRPLPARLASVSRANSC